MKKLLLLLLMGFIPMLLNADAIEINGIYYNLSTKAKEAEVTKNPNKYSGDIVIPLTIDYNEEEYKVTSIGQDAFKFCKELTSISIPNSITTIGYAAFYECTGLTSISIPNSVTSIEWYAFNRCSGLKSLTIPNSVTSIGALAFQRCTGLTSITIPNSITSIEDCTFSSCTALTSITIPNSVSSIKGEAFANCTGITSIIIPNSVTIIGSEAFYGCSSLESITIGTGIINIGNKSFAKCIELLNVYCYSENVPQTASSAFSDSYPSSITLHVPASSVEKYKAASPWSEFKEVIPLKDSEAGINNVWDDNKLIMARYNLEGQRLRCLQKGINIIRMNNGETKKINVK